MESIKDQIKRLIIEDLKFGNEQRYIENSEELKKELLVAEEKFHNLRCKHVNIGAQSILAELINKKHGCLKTISLLIWLCLNLTLSILPVYVAIFMYTLLVDNLWQLNTLNNIALLSFCVCLSIICKRTLGNNIIGFKLPEKEEIDDLICLLERAEEERNANREEIERDLFSLTGKSKPNMFYLFLSKYLRKRRVSCEILTMLPEAYSKEDLKNILKFDDNDGAYICYNDLIAMIKEYDKKEKTEKVYNQIFATIN